VSEPTSTGVDPRLSSLLCYTAWWVSGLIFLIIERQHSTVRFHAAQSLVLFGGLFIIIVLLLILSMAVLFMSGRAAFEATQVLVAIVWTGAVVIWLMLMYRTYNGETWRVPLAGNLAAKIAAR
jgi:uncharacterized membrane protein